MHRALEEHLASRDVTRVIYGSIIGLALVVALESHPPGTGPTIAALVGTAIAVWLAELYAELIGREAETRRAIHLRRVRRLAEETATVAFGVAFPAVFFVLVATDVIGTDTAFKLAKWTGLVLICAYGYLAARLSGASGGRAVVQAAIVGGIGAFLIALKALTH